jgi:hypothetical protein
MNIEDQKESFSKAYVRAIASVAGYDVTVPEYDRDSIDITFNSQKGKSIPVDAQLKATSRLDIISANTINFPLPKKNYDDLSRDTYSPRILIVLLLPNGFDDCPAKWINQTSDSLALMKCAYWYSLRGSPSKANTASVTVNIPMNDEHIFKPDTLNEILQQVSVIEV